MFELSTQLGIIISVIRREFLEKLGFTVTAMFFNGASRVPKVLPPVDGPVLFTRKVKSHNDANQMMSNLSKAMNTWPKRDRHSKLLELLQNTGKIISVNRSQVGEHFEINILFKDFSSMVTYTSEFAQLIDHKGLYGMDLQILESYKFV